MKVALAQPLKVILVCRVLSQKVLVILYQIDKRIILSNESLKKCVPKGMGKFEFSRIKLYNHVPLHQHPHEHQSLFVLYSFFIVKKIFVKNLRIPCLPIREKYRLGSRRSL